MILEELTGYKFPNETAARNAANALKAHYLNNAPASCTTTEWVDVWQGTYNSETFWYFEGDYTPVLGGSPDVFYVERAI